MSLSYNRLEMTDVNLPTAVVETHAELLASLNASQNDNGLYSPINTTKEIS